MKTENLPSGWSREPLASLARDITSGATPESGSPRYYTEAGGIRFAKIDDLTAASNRQLHGTFLHITPVALRAGTILLSMYGTVGLVKTTSCEMCANQALSALLPPFSCDPDYLAHALIWSRPRWDRYKAQTTQANINGRTVKQFECDLPPLREQRRIAEILDTLDEAIRKTEQVIAKLQQMKRGLLHDLLTRGIDENGELRDPERHPEQFKDSELGRIPRGWEVLRVGSALESIEQGWSPDCDTEAARKDQWGVLKTTSVTWAGYEDSASKSLPQHLPPRPEYEVRCEDVLMTRAGPNSRVGVVALVSATQGKLMLSDKLYRLSPKTKKLIPSARTLWRADAAASLNAEDGFSGIADEYLSGNCSFALDRNT
jgi:type I restriction enzyme, S subunit